MTTNESQNKQWYYEKNDSQVGPVSEDELMVLIQQGTLHRNSAVWTEGMPDWGKLGNTELGKMVPPTPPTSRHINNAKIWFSAFSPIIGYLLFLILFSNGGYDTNSHEDLMSADVLQSILAIISVAGSIALIYWDEAQLRSHNVDTTSLKGIRWFIPIYLYQRAELLKQRSAYLTTWYVCFAVIFVL